MYSIDEIARVVGGTFVHRGQESHVDSLVYDSRRITSASTSIFFALKTGHANGHQFLQDAYKKGIRNYIISDHVDQMPGSNMIKVSDTLSALHDLAAFHRRHFTIPVIGITGSNGKTIVKEWLYQLLQQDHIIARSPRSFNSQLGVPLSVWQLNGEHSLAIFEAGISRKDEMKKLASIIRPNIGVLTNIGEAHSEGFDSAANKTEEKLLLFEDVQVFIYPESIRQLDKIAQHNIFQDKNDTEKLCWGKNASSDFRITNIIKKPGKTLIEASFRNKVFSFTIPFTDDASVENAVTCCCVMLVLNYDPVEISKRMVSLHAIDMRLQLQHSFNECMVINDTYSNDVTSLKIALDFLQQQGSGYGKTLILSEFFESNVPDEVLYAQIRRLLTAYKISKAILIGEKIASYLHTEMEGIKVQAYLSTDDFVKDFKSSSFFHEIILIKGARKFELERVARLFEKKLHQTVLEINLDALANNLKQYQKLLNPGTKVMAMVKAFSYGSGGAEIASVLQYHNTDYLGVAYADEGVELVKAGIRIPVMVMNTESSSFRAIIDYNLEPVMYSFDLVEKFESYLSDQGLTQYPVHVEIETGMNRLGFSVEEAEQLAHHLSGSNICKVRSVFTHLASSEDPTQDNFTFSQAQLFQKAVTIIEQQVRYPFLKHVANSAAIIRHPHLQLDMVRLGIGLYGVEMNHTSLPSLQPVATLRSTIAQLKKVKKGDSVSYNRRGVVNKDALIGTVRIGYADGYSRQFSNGIGKMMVKGQLAPVIGSVCMDMTMIDVTDVSGIQEGDDVIIFGPGLPVQQLASWINTISYEIMTGISQRVNRIYFHE